MFVLQCLVFAPYVSTPSHTSPVSYGYNESGSLIYFVVDFSVDSSRSFLLKANLHT